MTKHLLAYDKFITNLCKVLIAGKFQGSKVS
jgi:hypothetical protein